MPSDIRDHVRERNEKLRYQISLSIPVMLKAEEVSKLCDLDICYIYVSEKEMSKYVSSYTGDLESLRSKVIQDFQGIYTSVTKNALEYYKFLFSECEKAGLLNTGEEALAENLEAGEPMSRHWLDRRKEFFEKRAASHKAQLCSEDLKIQDLLAIQNSLDEALARLIEAILTMYPILVKNHKIDREKDLLKWTKIRVFVGGAGKLGRLSTLGFG